MATHTLKKQSLKFFLIIIASTVFDVLLHQVQQDPLMNVSTRVQSIVITSGWFLPAASASLILAFCIKGLIFLMIQKNLPGTKLQKGGAFGIALGGMYFIGMIEAYVLFPVSFFGEVYTGIADGCAILCMSLLLGKYMSDDMPDREKDRHRAFPAMMIISVTYVAMRYFSYTVLHIESTYAVRPLATFLWTAAMGCWVGVMYGLVGRHIGQGSPLKQALLFGGIIFGLNWFIFNLFALLFIDYPVSDLLYRCVFDAIAIVIGVYISLLFQKSHNRQHKGC
ncbi:MAG: hypothetical protein NT178_09590 [Proteobacteria bacterium]|nr:hypothetical protein [Pseudomonadota bacterium]